jgi:hypothetical protein
MLAGYTTSQQYPYIEYVAIQSTRVVLQVAQGLSQLSRTASGNHPALLRLDICGTTLSHPDAIIHCRHLQHVNLGNNCLTTLQGLGALQQLAVLDASRNQLTQVLACRKHDVAALAQRCYSS